MSDGASDYLKSNPCICGEPYEVGSGRRCPVHEVGATVWDVSPINPNPIPYKMEHRSPADRLGAWLSAALDDPNVCDEMKGDIREWFDSRFGAVDMFPGNRKAYPVFTGLLRYFPDACAAVANCSHVANEQHNPGEPLHWARDKSIGEGDELLRHLMQAGTLDADGIRHSAKVAWRALELLQREIEAARK